MSRPAGVDAHLATHPDLGNHRIRHRLTGNEVEVRRPRHHTTTRIHRRIPTTQSPNDRHIQRNRTGINRHTTTTGNDHLGHRPRTTKPNPIRQPIRSPTIRPRLQQPRRHQPHKPRPNPGEAARVGAHVKELVGIPTARADDTCGRLGTDRRPDLGRSEAGRVLQKKGDRTGNVGTGHGSTRGDEVCRVGPTHRGKDIGARSEDVVARAVVGVSRSMIAGFRCGHGDRRSYPRRAVVACRQVVVTRGDDHRHTVGDK